MNIRSITSPLVAMLVASALVPQGVEAKPDPKPRIVFDEDGRDTIATALKTHCKDQFGDLSFQQRRKIVDSFKKFLDLMVDEYITRDPAPCNREIGTALDGFCTKGRKITLVIDFGQKPAVRVKPDGDPKITRKDEVRIGSSIFKAFLKDFLKAANHTGAASALPIPSSTSPAGYRFITDLIAQGLRLKHTTVIPGATDHTALRYKNYVEVQRRRIDIYKDLKKQLQELIDDPFNFFSNAKYRINRQIINKILRTSDEAKRKAIAERLLKRICEQFLDPLEKKFDLNWTRFKKKFGLDKDLSQDEIDEALDVIINENKGEPLNFEEWGADEKKTAHFVVPRGFFDPEATRAYIGGGGTYLIDDELRTIGSTTILQTNPEPYDSLPLEVTGVDHVYHAHLIDGGSTLLVVGGEIETGDGVLLGYSDTDGDGYFEPGTRTETIRDSELFGGAFFLTDPSDGATLIFTRSEHALFQLAYSGAAPHEFPDVIESRGSLGFQRNDLHYAEVSDDGLTAVGFGSDFDEPLAPTTRLPFANAELPGGEFIPSNEDYLPFADDPRAPDFAALPTENTELIAAFSPPGRQVAAVQVAGGAFDTLGSATADSDGNLTIPLNAPPQPGHLIRLIDMGNELASADQPVIASDSPPAIGATYYVEGGSYIFIYSGYPGSTLTLESSGDLINWLPSDIPPPDQYGSGAVEVPAELRGLNFRIISAE